jgi:hypothetical protein
MTKRGSSHVEMIFSFILFVGAIGFALYFFSPTNNSRLVQTSFDYLFRETESNASVEIFIFSAKINNSAIPIGLQIVGFNVSGSNPNYGAFVFDENGNNLSTKKIGNEEVYAQSTNWKTMSFVSIALAEEFNDSLALGGTINESYYTISSSLKKKVLSERRILKLNDTYYTNYTSLKEQFNIPGRVNFGFSLTFSDGSSITAQKEIPQSLEVFVNEKRIEVLRSNGRIEFANLVVKVW